MRAFQKIIAFFQQRPRFTLFLISFLFLKIVFIWLSLFILVYPENNFDLLLANWFYSWENPFLDKLMIFVSWFGEFFVSVSLIALLIYWLQRVYKDKGILLGVILIFGYLFSHLVKDVFDRARPDIFLTSGYTVPSGTSFPSLHVTFYTLFFGFVILLMVTGPQIKKTWKNIAIIFSAFLISLIGLSRIYLGVHWPTDVLGGYILGLILLEILGLIYFLLTSPGKKRFRNTR